MSRNNFVSRVALLEKKSPLLGGCYLEQERDNFLSMDCSHNQKQSEGELAIASHRVVSNAVELQLRKQQRL